MKRITMLIFALIAMVSTIEAQFLQPNSSIYGSRSLGVENKSQSIEPTERQRNIESSATYNPNQPANLQSQSFVVNNRNPQATLLDEGFDDITTLPGAGYSFVNVSDSQGSTDWFQGNDAVFPAQSGAPTAYIGANFNNTAGSVINNFMITPVLELENGDVVTFWTRSVTGSTFPDRLEVRLDPTGANTDPSGPADVGSYTELLLEINPTLTQGGYPEVWTEFTITISGLSGATNTRVAFRYWVTDAGPVGNNSDYIGIDTLTIEEGTGGGGGVCGSPILEINQDVDDTCMANITQTGLAQSYIPLEAEAAGAGIKFRDPSTGLNVDLSLWDGLPNAGGTMLASGTTQTDGTNWADVYWDPVVNVTVGNTYYIVIDGDTALPCISGSTNDPYPDGNVFANAGYNPFPTFDYTFRTYSCDSGGPACTSTAYDSTAVPFDIDGAGTSTSDCANAPNLIPVTVSDMGTIGSGATLENITIDIAHTFTADLDLYLVSPNGTELLLANDLGGGTDDGYNGTMFEDGGADITLATAPFGVGPYEPMGGTFAAAFAGEEIMGDWNLKVCDDAGGDTGQVLQFSMSICVPPVITNDDCANAYALACGDSVVGETLTATDSGGNAAPDVFYKFTGTGSAQLVTISLCGGGTDYDSVLRVFDDCNLANELAFNDDSCGLQSEVTFVSDGTSTYYIMVEGFGSGSGNFSLDVTCTEPLPNDDCGGAIAVSCGDSVTGTTVGATVDSGAPVCGPAITSPGVWYTLDDTSGLPGDITLSLCNGTDFDSKISVYTGSCAALTCVVGNDDSCGLQSEVTFATDGNTKFYILIHSFGGATGNFTMDVTCMPTPPPNDMIVNSIDVDEIGFPYTDPSVAMPAATTEDGNPQGCDLTGANGVWYNFVAGGDGTANAMIVTPGGASSVTFYTAPDENATETDLVLVPQNTNQCVPGTSASIFTLAGQAYYVFVLNTGAVTDIVIDGTNLGVSDNSIAGFSYYPNPTTGVLNLKSVDNIEHVSLYNLLGQRVLDSRVGAAATQLDLSGLSAGSYLMKVTVNGQTGTYKLLKD